MKAKRPYSNKEIPLWSAKTIVRWTIDINAFLLSPISKEEKRKKKGKSLLDTNK
jgi:hypothetical protein